MPRRACCGPLALLTVAWIGSGPAAAQIPDRFTNLQVLPEKIGREQLLDTMRSFSEALGVRCKFCHVGHSPDSLEGYDFASDDPEHKRVARGMMKMVDEINRKLLPAATGEGAGHVRCVTCHRGLDEPETLDHLLLEVVAKDGADAARQRYRELRERYYGSGGYDFGPRTLNHVADVLARERKDVDGALTLVRLNLEMHPEAAEPHLLLAQLLEVQGQREQALASVERALQLEPDNAFARRMLEKLRPPE